MNTPTLIGITILNIILGLGIYTYSPVEIPIPDAPIATEVTPQQELPTSAHMGTPIKPMLSSQSDQLLGNYAVAQNDMTLYLYTKDGAGKSNCVDSCAALWPPYTITQTDNIPVGEGVNGKVGTTLRADGTMQLTYNGMPLHFYSRDEKIGDMKGQNFEGVWFMVKP